MPGIRVFDMAGTQLPLPKSSEEPAVTGIGVGICLSAVMLWIKETIVTGDMHSDETLRLNRQVITMRQASFQFKSRVKHCEYLDLDQAVIGDLLAEYKLRLIRDGASDLFDFAEVAGFLGVLPGYYLLYFKNAHGNRGHALGFKFCSGGVCYLFDPAEGLFRFKDPASLAGHLSELNLTDFRDYIGGVFWYRQLTLG